MLSHRSQQVNKSGHRSLLIHEVPCPSSNCFQPTNRTRSIVHPQAFLIVRILPTPAFSTSLALRFKSSHFAVWQNVRRRYRPLQPTTVARNVNEIKYRYLKYLSNRFLQCYTQNFYKTTLNIPFDDIFLIFFEKIYLPRKLVKSVFSARLSRVSILLTRVLGVQSSRWNVKIF